MQLKQKERRKQPMQRKRPQTDMQDNYMEGYRPLKSRETGKVIKDEDGNDHTVTW